MLSGRCWMNTKPVDGSPMKASPLLHQPSTFFCADPALLTAPSKPQFPVSSGS
jgi:hypothetical protein